MTSAVVNRQGGFTLSLYDNSTDSHGLRARVMKSAQYLGPWCSRCGKRGTTCRNREACTLRIVNRHKVPAISATRQQTLYAQHMGRI